MTAPRDHLATPFALRAALLVALYGTVSPSRADDSVAETLQPVVVTATRRQLDIEDVPYNITAITAEELRATETTDLVQLARQVPSLSIVDLGTRYEAAEVPIIRGINASNIMQGPQQLAQSPVGVYIGSSPIAGYFQLTDVQRVEVLRGPQGTLYGAGALGGAIRVIPTSPELGVLSGSIGGNASSLARSSDASYGVEGFINIPIGDTLAFRASGKYAYDAGFVNAYGMVRRTDGAFSPPVLADPSEPATSPAIYGGERKDWNFAKTFTGRTSLLWKLEDFSAELAYINSHVEGDAGPQDDPVYPGGPYGIDPRITMPAGGDYKAFSPIDEPYRRTTTLTSLDLAYDVGFATLSSTTSYYDTRGTTYDNDTYGVFAFSPFEVYYTGNPVNPRFISVNEITDSDKTFSQEIRLVSRQADDKKIDYVVGAFYEKQNRHSDFDFAAPGTDTYSVAQGCTAPYYYGATFPNCLVTLGPNSTFFDSTAHQSFKDRSLFGELTWHAIGSAQVTFGVRHYWQDFDAVQSEVSYPFFSESNGAPNKTANSGNLYKINPSFEYAKDQNIYATWSQGFRRGGSNSFIVAGPLAESPQLLTYRADKTNNYEIGLKGRFSSGLSYSFAVFDIEWDNPQISGYTPYTDTPLVYNANKARSTGFEAESAGPLFLPGLRYNVSFGYADVRLTENFALPANNGTGSISSGLITGYSGERLPGSPKSSAAATITYEKPLSSQYRVVVTLNATYVGSVLSGLPTVNNPETALPAYTIGNISVALNRSPYQLIAYVDNVADKRAVLGYNTLPNPPVVGTISAFDVINRPREIGVRINYTF